MRSAIGWRIETVAALIAVVWLVASISQGTAATSREARVTLRVAPAAVTAGDNVSVAVVARARFERSNVSFLQIRESGQWRSIFVLKTDGAGEPESSTPCPRKGCSFESVGLAPKVRDVVRIPDVAPGRYRVMKEVTVGRRPKVVEIHDEIVVRNSCKSGTAPVSRRWGVLRGLGL